jgi:hypothetical protein
MQADLDLGETPGGLQAPHVVNVAGLYHMFYGDWENICQAVSADGKSFTRRLVANGKTAMFGEGPGNNTRDPMVLRVGESYHCYYTAHPAGKESVYCRISRDLQTWGESRIVSRGGSAGSGRCSAECPFVVHHEESDFYYLFRCQRYGVDAQSTVYRSRDPLDFGDNDDRCLACRLPVAAAETIRFEGRYYIACLLPSLKGIRIARLVWTPSC